MADHVHRRTVYQRGLSDGVRPVLQVGEVRAGQSHTRLTAWHGPRSVAVDLDAEQLEQLGIDLQIRASYMRSVRPPAGPEPDPAAPGPDDVPLIPDSQEAPR